MKIAILCPGYGRVARGVETFTSELAHRLLDFRPDWRIDVFCRGTSGEESPGLRRIHVPALDRDGGLATLYARVCHRLGLFLRTRIDAECLSFVLGLGPAFMFSRYDLVFNQAGPFAGRLLRMKRRMDGTPFVHKTASGYGDLELIMARQHPDAVIATSPYVKSWLEGETQGVRIECIPNAVDRASFRPYSPQEIDRSRNGSKLLDMRHPIVLFVGAMDPMKRPELLISAVSRLPDVSLVMVGNGRMTDSVVRLGQERLGERFLHIPRVAREKMPLYYNACDIFTLPSEEPFGIVFLEAMACNKPVLGHNSPVQQWMFEGAGATCDCTNVNEYSSAIRRLLSTDFGSRPLERSRLFDWSEVVPRYISVIEDVASSARGGRDVR